MSDLFITDEQYNEGFMLNEHNGTWSLVSANQGKDGKIYMRWCEVEVGPEKRKIKLPMGIKLGSSKEEALQRLQDFINQEGDNGDVPF